MADPGPSHPLESAVPHNIMNLFEFDAQSSSDKATAEGDTCRICRSEGTDDEPLFYPCKCSGSIKFVHQECLMEWLSHSNKKYCELCKTPFRFTKLYDSHMPHTLPMTVFIRKACLHVLRHLLTWVRALAVAFVWLIALPWCVRWSWRGMFWIVDSGWSRDDWLARHNATSAAPSFPQTPANVSSAAPGPALGEHSGPYGYGLSRIILGAIVSSLFGFEQIPGMSTGDSQNSSATNQDLSSGMQSSLLSGVKAVNSLTASPSMNRLILDIMEGQIITFLVVIAFILVFLIREWVVQQQPIIHAAAHIREAEIQFDAAEQAVRRINARHEQPVQPAEDAPVEAQPEADRVPGIAHVDATVEHQAGAGSGQQHPLSTHDASGLAGDILQSSRERPMNEDDRGSEHSGSVCGADSWQAVASSSPADSQIFENDIDPEHQAGASQPQLEFLELDEHGDVHPREPRTFEHLANDDNIERDTQLPQTSTPQAIQDQNEVGEGAGVPVNAQPPRDPAPTAAIDGGPKSLYERVLDWFWEGIVAEAEIEPQAAPVDEAFMHDAVDVLAEDPHIADDEEMPPGEDAGAQDPEVLQAAAEAGLDAEALDDVEDLEGILELIGMQGPLVGLLQTAMFCAVLITTTLWTAIGTPYLCGELALLFVGDPLVFCIMAPLTTLSVTADAIVDTVIYIGGVSTYFMAVVFTYVNSWVCKALLLNENALSFGFLSTRAASATAAASHRLVDMLVWDSPFETGFLLISLHAHQSLCVLKGEIANVVSYVLRVLFSVCFHLQNSTFTEMITAFSSTLSQESHEAKHYLGKLKEFAQGLISGASRNGTFTFTVTKEYRHLDPNLAHWSSTDRFLTVLTGYALLAAVGTVYLLRSEPLFSNPAMRKLENGLANFLKQAGGVLKVILIISIEMLVFPLYCGMLLDCALLPLFSLASVNSRLAFAARSPWLFAFVHWFIGTCYMFHFALFVSMCRRNMRAGVLYFIRDPDDPTFHPVRDVLERNVTTQLKKIAFSALVYGFLVICCLGGVVWGIDRIFTGVFPIHWAAPEPRREFPIDFMAYNILAPIVTRYLVPSRLLESFFRTWLKRCARMLRLSQFMFGDRHEDEEGHRSNQHSPGTELVGDGKYVRVPASDQVRIQKGGRVFLEVTEDNERLDGQADHKTGMHGKENKNFTKVYIPPWFRIRTALFIVGLWSYAATVGVGITVLPMLIGRQTLGRAFGRSTRVNDLYAYTTGLLLLSTALYVIKQGRSGLRGLRRKTSGASLTSIPRGIMDLTYRIAASAYVYGFALLVVPALCACLLQLYFVLPLRTFLVSMEWIQTERFPFGAMKFNNTASALAAEQMVHTFYVLQDWTLGFVHARIALRLLASHNSRPAAALRMITRDGYTKPNARLATRAFIIPTVLLFLSLVLLPIGIGKLFNALLLTANFQSVALSSALRTKVYRYSYPIFASQSLALWSVWGVIKATQRWRSRIRDEVYLIGEKLHNFGERRPPEGSKSVVRMSA